MAITTDSPTFWRDPALPFAESRRACDSRACYRPHHHPTFSIGAVDAGTSVFTGAGETAVSLAPGTLVFVPAGRVHACNPAPDSAWSYQMLHLDAEWLRKVRAEAAAGLIPTEVAGAMHAEALNGEPVRVVADPVVYERFCALNRTLFSRADAAEKEAALIEFIGDCDAAQGLTLPTVNAPAELAARLAPALARLREAPEVEVTLEALSRLAGLSRYQLIRAFRAVTGLTPHAWQLNQRVTLARERLREGESLAAVAHGLGFADQAHFQRVFKAHAGVTPGVFRA